jgi:hypothetical protein
MRGGDLGEIADARLQAGRLSAQRLCGEAEIRLQLVRRQGPAVFFRAATPSGTCTVLTVAMLLARGPQRVAALAFPIDSVIA